MVRLDWRIAVSCLAVGEWVGFAAAQNPTFSLIPSAAATRKCVGGPEQGLACTNTADCERDAQGAVYSDCRHLCKGGRDDGWPCTSSFDCQTGICEQKCFCNYWIQGSRGGFVLVEVWGSNWSPNGELLGGWQVSIDLQSTCEAVRPFGWDRPCDPADYTQCQSDADCPEQYPICDLRVEVCQGPNHAPGEYSFTCEPGFACVSRTDYVFYGLPELQATDFSTLCYRYGSVLLQPPGVLYETPKYFGTLALQIQPAICSTVTIGLNCGVSAMIDENSGEITPLDLESLTIVTPYHCPLILDSVPPNCTIDGRQNSEPDGSSPSGWTSIAVQLLANDQTVAGVTTTDFNMREVPGGATFNPDSVSADDPALGWVTLTFPPATAGQWTCVRNRNSWDSEVCFGSQPGDADGNLASEAADLTHLTDCITGVPCELHECDIDRSGTCSGPDLLRAVDLLGGAQSYAPGRLGTSLPACPTGR